MWTMSLYECLKSSLIDPAFNIHITVSHHTDEYDIVLEKKYLSNDFQASQFIKMYKQRKKNHQVYEILLNKELIAEVYFKNSFSPNSYEFPNIDDVGVCYFRYHDSRDSFLNLSNYFLSNILLKSFKLFLFIGEKEGSIPKQFQNVVGVISDNHKCSLSQLERTSKTCYLVSRQHNLKDINQLAGCNVCRTIVLGNFQIKHASDVAQFDSYLSTRLLHLSQLSEDRNEDNLVDYKSMLPFVVFFDFYSTNSIFNPDKITKQKLKNATFILYNFSRIHHLRNAYSVRTKENQKNVDYSILTSPLEWRIISMLLIFPSIVQENVFQVVEHGGTLKLHKVLQYISALVSAFSKFYSASKIITYDEKESLIIKMDSRMMLVNGVYDVLSYCFTEVFRLPYLQTM